MLFQHFTDIVLVTVSICPCSTVVVVLHDRAVSLPPKARDALTTHRVRGVDHVGMVRPASVWDRATLVMAILALHFGADVAPVFVVAEVCLG